MPLNSLLMLPLARASSTFKPPLSSKRERKLTTKKKDQVPIRTPVRPTRPSPSTSLASLSFHLNYKK